MARGKLSTRLSYSTRKPKKQKTLFGLRFGPAPKSDYQKRVDAGATVFTTGAGGKITTTSSGKLVTAKEQQSIRKDLKTETYSSSKPTIGKAIQQTMQPRSLAGGTKAPHDDIYKAVPKVSSNVHGSGPNVKIPKPSPVKPITTTKAPPHHNIYRPVPKVSTKAKKPILVYELNKVLGSYTGRKLDARKLVATSSNTASNQKGVNWSSVVSNPLKALLDKWKKAGQATLKQNQKNLKRVQELKGQSFATGGFRRSGN